MLQVGFQSKINNRLVNSVDPDKPSRPDLHCLQIQSTLVISNSKGLCEILRDIRTSTYHICRIEETVNRPTIFNKCICNLAPEVRYILKILRKREEIAL